MATDKEAQAAKINAMLATMEKLNEAEKMKDEAKLSTKLSKDTYANGGMIGWTQEPSKWFNASLTVDPIYEAKGVVASSTAAKPHSVASISNALTEAKSRHENEFSKGLVGATVGGKDYFAFAVNGSAIVVHKDDLMELLKVVDERARGAFPPEDML